MTIHFIDSASLYQLVELYTKPNLDSELYPWLEQSALHVTQILLIQPHISISPSSTVTGGASGLYARLTTALSEIVAFPTPSSQIRSLNSEAVVKWALDDSEKISNVYLKLESDRENFRKWEQWAIENAWLEHSTRSGGLFDQPFVPAIAKILKASEEELDELQKESRDKAILNSYITGGRETRAFRLTRGAYVVAALLRGKFHEHNFRSNGSSILQHPLRYGILEAADPKDDEAYPNSLSYLASIALISAFSEANPAARIEKYCKNLSILRKSLSGITSDNPLAKFPGSHSSEEARIRAARFSKDARVDISSKFLDSFIDQSFFVGEAVAGLILTPWQSIAASALSRLLPGDLGTGNELANKLLRTEERLNSMTYFGEGGRVWSRPE